MHVSMKRVVELKPVGIGMVKQGKCHFQQNLAFGRVTRLIILSLWRLHVQFRVWLSLHCHQWLSQESSSSTSCIVDQQDNSIFSLLTYTQWSLTHTAPFRLGKQCTRSNSWMPRLLLLTKQISGTLPTTVIHAARFFAKYIIISFSEKCYCE